MTELEYMKEKNAILFEYTGKILVPKSQLVDVKISKPLSYENDSKACPYCHLYGVTCLDCPMHKAGNSCEDYDNEGRTYKIVSDILYNKHGMDIHQVPEIIALVNKFNEEFKG